MSSQSMKFLALSEFDILLVVSSTSWSKPTWMAMAECSVAVLKTSWNDLICKNSTCSYVQVTSTIAPVCSRSQSPNFDFETFFSEYEELLREWSMSGENPSYETPSFCDLGIQIQLEVKKNHIRLGFRPIWKLRGFSKQSSSSKQHRFEIAEAKEADSSNFRLPKFLLDNDPTDRRYRGIMIKAVPLW